MELNGAEILIECLKEQKVDIIFGYPGGAVLNIYDALYKHQHEIKHIRTAHEQGAAHAADGYARATGKVGVCLATSGPGATNLVTGIATAFMDSIPMVAITGNVTMPLLGKDSFQEVDITGITMPITKHNYIVKDVADLADTIRKAFYIAQEGRPGPVLIDIPKDVTANKAEYIFKEPKEIKKHIKSIKAEDIQRAIEIIKKAKKPLIYAGGGIIAANASKELYEFADKIDSPVSCSLMGLGGYPGTDERFLGMIGMHGAKASNLSVTHCDLLIAVGARFSDRVVSDASRFAKHANILHIDVDPAEINKNVRSYHSIIGDLDEILKTLNEKLEKKENTEWMSKVRNWKAEFPVVYKETGFVKAHHLLQKIYELTNGEAVITTEVGQHQMWTAQCYTYTKPRTFISSGGLGTMGYGFGASMGAQLGLPDKKVFNIAGDGSFRMNCNELITASTYNIPVIIIVLNNHTLGMVRQWQKLFYDERFSQVTLEKDINYLKLAESFDVYGLEIKNESEIDDVLKKAITHNGPVLINCLIDTDDSVFPMVPPGAAVDELIMEGEL